MDTIEIKNLRLRCIVGFSPHELAAPQDIVINLQIGCDGRLAGESDEPAAAFNYKTVTKAIIAFVKEGRFALVEKLAQEIARIAVVDFGARRVTVSVEKPGALRRSDSVGVRIERSAADFARNVAYLSLGSNIRPAENMAAAIALLRRHTTLLALSPVYRTAPQGFARQPAFLNMAAKAHTRRRPAAFRSHVIDRIERELGRVRDPDNINAPRTIDLDLSLWNDESFFYGDKPWAIPDDDILRFAHVAQPLADLAPDYRLPGDGRSLRDIAADLDASGLEHITLDMGTPSV